MAKAKKYYYYVLVMTESGATFVTAVDYYNKVANWNKDEKPLELSQVWADDLCLGLTLNGNVAYTIKVPYEIDGQPYRYDVGHFEWKFNEQ